MPSSYRKLSRRQVCIRRAVHVVCMALNFWYQGESFGDTQLLRRVPRSYHYALYDRIEALLESEGPVIVEDIPKAGRRMPELVSRLSELSAKLTELGPTSNPYDKSFAGVTVDHPYPEEVELAPYHDLDPQRIVLHGTGQWDISSFLDDDLIMSFKDPSVLLHHNGPGDGPQIRDKPEVVAKLCHKWDNLGLLHVHDRPIDPNGLVRIFGALKDSTTDRQIGDRSPLQTGRTISNTIGPAIPEQLLQDTNAYSHFMIRSSQKYVRSDHGDLLGGDACFKPGGSFVPSLEDGALSFPGKGHLWVAFNSVLQGDHLGVEIATQGHTNLLKSVGLLEDNVRMVFFSLSVEPRKSPGETSRVFEAYARAQQIYKEHDLLGSPHKDLIATDEGKVIGAYVNSSDRALDRGLCAVGAPPAKRMAMSYLSLLASQLPYTTDSLWLCTLGGWVSILGYRRPMMSVLQDSFNVVDMSSFDKDNPKMLPLSRKVASELVLLACLAPLAVSDIAVPFDCEAYCTDASIHKGAILKTKLKPQVAEVLWKTSRSKGAYSRLLSPLEEALKRLGAFEDVPDEDEELPMDRPMAFQYEFIEVCAGAAKISRYMQEAGFKVGPPIDLSRSEELNLAWDHVAAWLTWMISEKRILGFFGSPPCTTFSIMRRPRLRSKQCSLGFNPKEPKTLLGNTLGCRACQLLYVAWVNGLVGMLENPFSSYMKHLPAWRIVCSKSEVSEVRCDSCRFGSPHQKSFRLMGLSLDMAPLQKKCNCKKLHLKVEGAYAKASAIYTDSLAKTIASVLADGIVEVKHRHAEMRSVKTKGFECQLSNEVAKASQWELVEVWTFRKHSHINLLEESAVLRICSILARSGSPKRIAIGVDSSVVRFATSKGRTSSRGLSSLLRRVTSLCVAAGLYVVLPFIPTRLNFADDPTREREVRPPITSDILEWDKDDLFNLAALPKLRRWASNWACLVVKLCGPAVLSFADRSAYRQVRFFQGLSQFSATADCQNNNDPEVRWDFDKTLGFPGEGPHWFNFFIFSVNAFLLWIFRLPYLALSWIFSAPCRLILANAGSSFAAVSYSSGLVLRPSFRGCWVLALLCFTSHSAAMETRTAAEFRRAAERARRPDLPQGRPVTTATTRLRDRYWSIFEQWVASQEIDLQELLVHYHTNVEEINLLLVRYGRVLFQRGKTYNQFAETINSLADRKPVLRRLLQGAWDLGFAWAKQEPSQHHIALPVPILLAMISTSLIWGWLEVAGLLALGFGALLRPGELTQATRQDLLLPADVGFTIGHVLLSIAEPKTRFSQARHQSARLDSSDLVAVVDLACRTLPPGRKLWPYSAQTLRGRFKSLLASLELPTEHSAPLRCLDLGSLRSGGATFIIQSTENGELCRRRGRWSTARMMEIYVQETMALQYMKLIPECSRAKVLAVLSTFHEVLQLAERFVAASIPRNALFLLFTQQK
eukprot:Skav209436  [mRNA]  locus=scaffold805:189644:194096:- [translate_table: standard]